MPTLIIAASLDSHMSQIQPNTNYGADTGIVHGVVYAGSTKIQWRRGIVNFNVSALAGTAIVDAKLVRDVSFVTGAGGVLARIARCKRPADWVESQVTWNSYANGSAWTLGGGDIDEAVPPKIDYTEPGATGSHEVPGLKPFVVDALAMRAGIVSLITRLFFEDPDVTQEIGWRSREYGADGWRLVVEYEISNAGRRSESFVEGPSLRGAQPARARRPAQAATAQRERRSRRDRPELVRRGGGLSGPEAILPSQNIVFCKTNS